MPKNLNHSKYKKRDNTLDNCTRQTLQLMHAGASSKEWKQIRRNRHLGEELHPPRYTRIEYIINKLK